MRFRSHFLLEAVWWRPPGGRPAPLCTERRSPGSQEAAFLALPATQSAYSFAPKARTTAEVEWSAWKSGRKETSKCSRAQSPASGGTGSLVHRAPSRGRGHASCFASKQIHSHSTPSKEEINVRVIEASP